MLQLQLSRNLEDGHHDPFNDIVSIMHEFSLDRPTGSGIGGVHVRLMGDLVPTIGNRTKLSLHCLCVGSEFAGHLQTTLFLCKMGVILNVLSRQQRISHSPCRREQFQFCFFF